MPSGIERRLEEPGVLPPLEASPAAVPIAARLPLADRPMPGAPDAAGLRDALPMEVAAGADAGLGLA